MKLIRIALLGIATCGSPAFVFDALAAFIAEAQTMSNQVETGYGADPDYKVQFYSGGSITAESETKRNDNTGTAFASVNTEKAQVKVSAEAHTGNGETLPIAASARASYSNTARSYDRISGLPQFRNGFQFLFIFQGGINLNGSSSSGRGGVSYYFGSGDTVFAAEEYSFETVPGSIITFNLRDVDFSSGLEMNFEIWAEAVGGINEGDSAVVAAADSFTLAGLYALNDDGTVDPTVVFIGDDGTNFSQFVPEPSSVALSFVASMGFWGALARRQRLQKASRTH